MTGSPAATAALLHGLASWDAVTGLVRWRGPVDELAAALPAHVPTAASRHAWMLRVVDAPAAVAARGFHPGLCAEATFTLVDPQLPEPEQAWHLTVAGGKGVLEPAAAGAPRLHVRGLGLLFAGLAGPGLLRRCGLLEKDVPGLGVFAGPAPLLLDEF